VSSRVYLDHASSSPLRPAAFDAMVPYLRDHFADPGRVHSDGRVTRVAIETAREQVAALVGARPREVVFTSGGTEAVNAAVYGSARRASGATRIVTTAVEHSSVLDAIDATTALVTVQLANHEVGTLQPVADVCAGARDRGVLVHVDACAAIGYVDLDVAAIGADLTSITAHTWGGPKGTGALVVRRGLRIPPFVVGGAQERARRGGIENIPAVVGFGAAAAELATTLDDEIRTARRQQGRLAGLGGVAGVEFESDPAHGLPNLTCVTVAGLEAEPILLALDQQGIAVHSGSACSSESLEPSPVLAAMGADADHSLRVSTGWSTTDADVDRLLAVFPQVVGRLRGLRT